MQTTVEPEITGAGTVFTLNDEIVFAQPVVELVKVNVALPAATPEITPAGDVTVATAVLLLTQVPPVVGVKLAVDPIQTFELVTLTVGNGFTLSVARPLVVAEPLAEQFEITQR